MPMYGNLQENFKDSDFPPPATGGTSHLGRPVDLRLQRQKSVLNLLQH